MAMKNREVDLDSDDEDENLALDEDVEMTQAHAPPLRKEGANLQGQISTKSKGMALFSGEGDGKCIQGKEVQDGNGFEAFLGELHQHGIRCKSTPNGDKNGSVLYRAKDGREFTSMAQVYKEIRHSFDFGKFLMDRNPTPGPLKCLLDAWESDNESAKPLKWDSDSFKHVIQRIKWVDLSQKRKTETNWITPDVIQQEIANGLLDDYLDLPKMMERVPTLFKTSLQQRIESLKSEHEASNGNYKSKTRNPSRKTQDGPIVSDVPFTKTNTCKVPLHSNEKRKRKTSRKRPASMALSGRKLDGFDWSMSNASASVERTSNRSEKVLRKFEKFIPVNSSDVDFSLPNENERQEKIAERYMSNGRSFGSTSEAKQMLRELLRRLKAINDVGQGKRIRRRLIKLMLSDIWPTKTDAGKIAAGRVFFEATEADVTFLAPVFRTIRSFLEEAEKALTCLLYYEFWYFQFSRKYSLPYLELFMQNTTIRIPRFEPMHGLMKVPEYHKCIEELGVAAYERGKSRKSNLDMELLNVDGRNFSKKNSRDDVFEKCVRLAWVLKTAREKHLRVTAFTGAGISTGMGANLPTVRGETAQNGNSKDGFDPYVLERIVPTRSHYIIKAFSSTRHIQFTVTQNIENLHRLSGLPKSRTWEVHGNIFDFKCPGCGTEYHEDNPVPSSMVCTNHKAHGLDTGGSSSSIHQKSTQARESGREKKADSAGGYLADEEKMEPGSLQNEAARANGPMSSSSKNRFTRHSGSLRRNVVMRYGERVRPPPQALKFLNRTQVCLVIGSSLRVGCISSLICPDVVHKRPLICIINLGPTSPKVDNWAEKHGLRIDAECDYVLDIVAHVLDVSIPGQDRNLKCNRPLLRERGETEVDLERIFFGERRITKKTRKRTI